MHGSGVDKPQTVRVDEPQLHLDGERSAGGKSRRLKAVLDVSVTDRGGDRQAMTRRTGFLGIDMEGSEVENYTFGLRSAGVVVKADEPFSPAGAMECRGNSIQRKRLDRTSGAA